VPQTIIESVQKHFLIFALRNLDGIPVDYYHLIDADLNKSTCRHYNTAELAMP